MLEITGAMSSAVTAFELIKAAVAARDDVKLQVAITDMTSRLLAANQAALEMAVANSALKAALDEAERQAEGLKAQLEDNACYELVELMKGVFGWRFVQSPEKPVQPAHHVCAPCRAHGIKSVLREYAQQDAPSLWVCPENVRHNC